MQSSIYIVCYYWPPAGGPGVQRWLTMSHYLVESNYHVTVVIPENADYPVTDASLTNDINPKITIKKIAIKEPTRWIKKILGGKTAQLQKGILNKKPGLLERALLWVRGNYFIPDARKSWADRVVQELENDSAFAKAKTLITTGPPHSVHLVGLKLKKRFTKNIEWIADFRDPWTTIGYHDKLRLSLNAQEKHLKLEKQVLDSADKLLVTSPTTRAEFEAKTKTAITVITNGFNIEPNNTSQPAGKFTLSHIGTLLADRNPIHLWITLAELIEIREDFAADFKLQLAGNVGDDIINSLKECQLLNYTNLKGYLSHQEAVNAMYNSQALLLIEIDSADTQAIIPGKLFEYIASRRPVIAIGPEQSDIIQILYESNAGTYFKYRDPHLSRHILELYQAYKKNELLGNHQEINNYHRSNLTDQLIKIIQKR
ncbi:glycosyltransferase family protein [Nonlabens ponticola]|uniref:Glycosyl transferase family 1 n=1 Tax=Nonlabens ponticola TaxID=2496866 RepID=A0A3S9MYL2_9FLAO|nr:glycosyl transferase family 1 [Nonlabens ponticola]AZQ44239.1 glycosyl transferase family 1 [Nonlabens ponticola]